MTLEWIIIVLAVLLLVCAVGKAIGYKYEINRLKKIIYKISGERIVNENAANKDNDSAEYF